MVEEEKPDLVLMGKQAIDGDNNATGQMLAALLGWPQATFASKVEIEGDKAKVTREVDGGLQTLEVDLPAVVTADLRLNEPRYASPAQHHEGQEEADRRRRTLAELGVDIAPRLTVLKVTEPPKRAGRRQGRERRRAGVQAEERSGGDLMAVLVIADHDNAHVRDTTHKTVTAALKLSSDVDVLVAGKGCDAVADAGRQDRRRAQGAARPRATSWTRAWPRPARRCVVPLMANYDAVLTPATSQGKNFAPRIAAALDVSQISEIIEVVDASTFVRPIYAGNALETVKTSDAKKVITVRADRLQGGGRGRLGHDREDRRAGARRPTPASSARRWSSPTGPSWPAPRSSSPAAAPWARPRSSSG